MTLQALFTGSLVTAGNAASQSSKVPFGQEADSDSFENMVNSKMDTDKKVAVSKPTERQDRVAENTETEVSESADEDTVDTVEEVTETVEEQTEDSIEEVTEEVMDAVEEVVKEQLETVTETETSTEPDAEEKDNLLKAFEAFAALQNEIIKVFNISEEELNMVCEEMGIEPLELLKTDNLQKFIMQLNGTKDITAFITDENMAEQYQEILKLLEETVAEEDVDVEMLMKTLEENPEIDVQDVLKDNVQDIESNIAENIDMPQQEIVSEVTENPESTKEYLLRDDDRKTDGVTKDKAAVNGIEGFIQKLGEVYAENNAEAITTEGLNRLTDIAARVIEQIRVNMSPDQTSLEVQLYPEHLGRVAITVSTRDGVMTANIATQNETAKEAIESQIAVLRETFENQGLKVDAIEVTVSNFEFERDGSTGAREEQNQSRQRKFRDESVLADFEPETEQILPIIEGSGENINYRA